MFEWNDVQGYLQGVAEKHAWRFVGTMDEADLLQELAIIYIDVQKRVDRSKGPRACMAMLRNRVNWWLVDQMRRSSKNVRSLPLVNDEETDLLSELAVDDSNPADLVESAEDIEMMRAVLKAKISEAPEPVQRYALALINDDTRRTTESGRLEVAGEAIRRITGLPSSTFYLLWKRWATETLGVAVLKT